MTWFINLKNCKIPGLEYIIFGQYYSDDYGDGKYSIYKLTKDKLYIDKSEKWHTKHDSLKKYKFRGAIASNEKFEIAKELLHKVPKVIRTEKLKRYGKNFGSKRQDNLIIEVYNGTNKTSVVIDSYIIETKNLPNAIRTFRALVQKKIKEIESLE